MMKKKRTTAARLLALLLCAALCLSLTACGKDDEGGVKLKDGPRFTVAVAQEPDSFNPVLSRGGLSEEFFLLCYDPLWRLDSDGNPTPCLAEDWSLSSDRLTWTIRLRHDAVFSDGQPVTSADVQFSYELMRHGDTVFTSYFDGVTDVRCPDDYTVVISTEHVKGDMLHNPTPILPRHIWRDYEFDPGSFENAELIGSGPFVFVSDPEGEEEGWSFRARADHFLGKAAVGEVFFARYSTVTGAARALSAGEADASFGLTDVQLTTLEGVPGVELMQAILPTAECQLLLFNTRSELFSQESMRQAIEYSIDRDWFLSMASGGAGMTGSSFLSPGVEGFAIPDGLRSYDPERTAGVLRAAGYMDVDEDGILEYGPRELELSLTLWTSGQDPWSATAAAILSQDLEKLGVPLNWRKTDGDIEKVCGDDDDWDMCFMSLRGGYSAAVTALRFASRTGGITGWTDPLFDSGLDQLISAEDGDMIRGYARQLQQLVYNACPVVVFAYGADIQAIRKDSWTGFEDRMTGGGLFHTGGIETYMSVTPRTAEEE